MKKVYMILYVFLLLVLSSSVSAYREPVIVWNFEQNPITSNLTNQIPGDNNDSFIVDISGRDTSINNYGWNFTAGDTNFVGVPISALDGMKNVSIGCWVKPTSIGTHMAIFYGYDVSAGDGSYIRIGETGNIRWQLVTAIGAAAIGEASSYKVSVGNWYFVAMVYDYTTSRMTGYLNDSLAGNVSATGIVDVTSDLNFGKHPSGTWYLSAIVDECYIWKEVLTQAEITEIWNNGVGSFYDAGVPGIPATPTIIVPSPADNSNNNTNVTLNVSHSTVINDVRYYLYFGDTTPLTETDLIYNNVTRNGTEYSEWFTDVPDGVYYWKFRVQNTSNGLFSSNTSERTWTLDTVTPTISILANTTFKIDNSTIRSSYINDLSINISFFDLNLYQTLINITNSTDESVYSILNTSITGTTANYSRVIDIGSWAVGNYTIKLVATDSHTTDSINDYDIRTGLNYFRYTTEEGNIIKITSDTMPLTRRTTKYEDRYDFEFNYLFQKDTYKFTVESYNKIDYIDDSEYKAHFVIMGSDGRGNWIDFENPYLNSKDYKVTKIDDYIYEVEVTANGIKSFTFSSIGGLNKVEEHYKLRVGAVIDVWVYDGEDYPTQVNTTVTSNSQSANSTTDVSGARLVNITKEITELTLISSGYGTEGKDISITNNYHNFSFNMSPVLATKLYFYDESSGALIIGETFSVYMETTGFSNTYSSIIANPHTITGLTAGLYKLKASSTNYPERQYLDLSISNTTTTNLNIYLLNSTDGSEITFNVVDSNSEDIEDVSVDFYRTIAGTSTLVAQEQTDYSGKFKLYMDTNYEYIINFSKSGYNAKTINLEPSVADSPYTIYLDDDVAIIPPLAVAYTIRDIFRDGLTYNLTYANATRVVHFDWYDENSYVDSVCMKVYDLTQSFYSNCSILNTGYMNYTITTLNKTYIAKAWVRKDSKDYTLKIININLMEVLEKLGKDMIILAWVVFLTLSFIGLAKPYAALFLGTFALIGMYLIGMLPIGFGTIMGIISVVIIISIGIRRSRQ